MNQLTREKKQPFLEHLPDEIIKIIFLDLKPGEMRSLSRTCKRFHRIIDEQHWKPICLKNPISFGCPIVTSCTWQQKYLIYLDSDKHHSNGTELRKKLCNTNIIMAYDRDSMKNVFLVGFIMVPTIILTALQLSKLILTNAPTSKRIVIYGVMTPFFSMFFQIIYNKYDFSIYSKGYKYYHQVGYYKKVLSSVSKFAKRWNTVLNFRQVFAFGKFCWRTLTGPPAITSR